MSSSIVSIYPAVSHSVIMKHHETVITAFSQPQSVQQQSVSQSFVALFYTVDCNVYSNRRLHSLQGGENIELTLSYILQNEYRQWDRFVWTRFPIELVYLYIFNTVYIYRYKTVEFAIFVYSTFVMLFIIALLFSHIIHYVVNTLFLNHRSCRYELY